MLQLFEQLLPPEFQPGSPGLYFQLSQWNSRFLFRLSSNFVKHVRVAGIRGFQRSHGAVQPEGEESGFSPLPKTGFSL